MVPSVFVTGATWQHSSFVAVSAKTTWHPCVSHSSLVCGDSSPIRLLIPVFWYNVWLILSVVVTVGEVLESAEDSVDL